jgi:hypothetical protein
VPRAYSFKDVSCTFKAQEGTFSIGMGAGVAEEGISFEKVEERNTMMLGIYGDAIHFLHASDASIIRLRLLKTTPTNGQLMRVYKQQFINGPQWGKNLISLQDRARGDKIVASEVAFTGEPNLTYGKVAGINEWVFHAAHIEDTLNGGETLITTP